MAIRTGHTSDDPCAGLNFQVALKAAQGFAFGAFLHAGGFQRGIGAAQGVPRFT